MTFVGSWLVLKAVESLYETCVFVFLKRLVFFVGYVIRKAASGTDYVYI